MDSSVVKYAQISRYNFVFQKRTRWDINSFAVIGNDYHRALQHQQHICTLLKALNFENEKTNDLFTCHGQLSRAHRRDGGSKARMTSSSTSTHICPNI